MKHPISMILCCLVLAACNDMITRWWNGGPYISAKEKKAYRDLCKIPQKSPKFPQRHLGDFS